MCGRGGACSSRSLCDRTSKCLPPRGRWRGEAVTEGACGTSRFGKTSRCTRAQFVSFVSGPSRTPVPTAGDFSSAWEIRDLTRANTVRPYGWLVHRRPPSFRQSAESHRRGGSNSSDRAALLQSGASGRERACPREQPISASIANSFLHRPPDLSAISRKPKWRSPHAVTPQKRDRHAAAILTAEPQHFNRAPKGANELRS